MEKVLLEAFQVLQVQLQVVPVVLQLHQVVAQVFLVETVLLLVELAQQEVLVSVVQQVLLAELPVTEVLEVQVDLHYQAHQVMEDMAEETDLVQLDSDPKSTATIRSSFRLRAAVSISPCFSCTRVGRTTMRVHARAKSA